jgi:hypothetical protein
VVRCPQPHGNRAKAAVLIVDVEHSDEVDGSAASKSAGDAPKKWFKWSGGRGDVFQVRAMLSQTASPAPSFGA